MRDVELYQQLLGLGSPWTVDRVELSVQGERVDIWATHVPEVRWPCPECEALLPVYDHAQERSWRHLDSCQFKTYLHARVPRVKCPTHGARQVKLPWAEAHSRFTVLFERLAIDVLKEATVRGATRILRISWDEAWHLMQRAVRRGLQAKGKSVPERLGVDEKALSKGARYITLVCDLDAATIEHVAEARRMESLDGYYLSFPAAQLERIRAVAMDTLLVRTYSSALSSYRDQKFDFRPLRAKPVGTDVTVQVRILQTGTEPVSLDYDMEKTPSGWKVYDMRVTGVSLVANYRTEFANEVHARGVDGLIETLARKNRDLAQRAEKK